MRRDVRAAEAWLERHRLHLRRLPGVGVVVRGSEIDVRGGCSRSSSSSVPANVLADEAGCRRRVARRRDPASTGLAPFVAELDLPTFRAILRARAARRRRPTELLMATLAWRSSPGGSGAGRPAAWPRGRLRSLMDHPVSEVAGRIAVAMATAIGLPLGHAEVAAITESLLGLVELSRHARAARDARTAA